ncbi:hypothetical protein D9758_015052 [Tetrapyrgos nigripes]|uniref:Uncharacterized protein n=1 Tax=Tetrapyrgos nigripes TaxID=182062 RepID=A0A8H5FS01_9AGAR|nr:hypothetical protein D9758_015052 [Tetrapyrgos nigripes]
MKVIVTMALFSLSEDVIAAALGRLVLVGHELANQGQAHNDLEQDILVFSWEYALLQDCCHCFEDDWMNRLNRVESEEGKISFTFTYINPVLTSGSSSRPLHCWDQHFLHQVDSASLSITKNYDEQQRGMQEIESSLGANTCNSLDIQRNYRSLMTIINTTPKTFGAISHPGQVYEVLFKACLLITTTYGNNIVGEILLVSVSYME